VWWARPRDAGEFPSLAGLLDDIEVERWKAYRLPEDQNRFLVGCALTKSVVAQELGLRPGDIALDRTCTQCGKPHGKPRLTGSARDLAGGDLELSLSHSGDRVTVAAFRGAPVGVDVEDSIGRTRGEQDTDALERYVLSDAEIAAYPVGPAVRDPQERLRNFLVIWTRKEAVTKATGDGLRVPFREVIVSAPTQPPSVVAWPYPEPPANVSLFDLNDDAGPGPGYAAALAVIGRCDAVVSQDGTALLGQVANL
jgi:4'-phosphopantetheinyl transferase